MLKSTILRALAFAIGVLALAPALAQEWPSRPIRLIVPFPPGGGLDYIARLLGPYLSERLGQTVVVDNRAGANGIVGLQVLMAAAPDGYTLCVVSAGPLVVNPHVYLKLPYDTLKDFTAISSLVNFPLLLVVRPDLPAKDVKELIAYGRANPNKISYSSPGVGNTNHLAGELFASMANIVMLHVPYKGSGPAVIALLSGEVNSTFSNIPSVIPHVRGGRLKVIGVGNAQRLPFLPEIATISEAGLPGYEAFTWGGLIGPANMPARVVQRLNTEFGEILRQKEIADRLINEGAVPTPSSAAQYAAYIRSELQKWGEIVKSAKIKPE